MVNKIILFLGFTLFVITSKAQYTQVGNGGFSSPTYGPMTSDTTTPFYSRHAYIYPSGSIISLQHGDSISALGFKHNSFDTLAGNCNFKIYVKNTSNADFGASSLNWVAETRNGMTLVYDGNPKTSIGSSPGDAIFKFNQGGKYTFDTTGNATNFQILVEFKQNANQVASIPWYCESSFYVPSFVSGNETKYIRGSGLSGMDSMTLFSSSIKPTLTIFHPKDGVDLEALNVYSLGTVPILMIRPDTVKAIIRNVGNKTAYNHKVYLDVSGANTQLDSIRIDSILPFEKKLIYFGDYKPANQGAESLKVKIDTDSNTLNNESVKNRIVNYNVYSHADPFTGNSGGIGFNGSTGDFVAKFYVDGTSYINQIKVDFSSVGRVFQLGVWNDDGPGGLPGTELFMSDTSYSTAGTFIMSVLPRIQVGGGFYIGIRQAGSINVGFSFQYERPVRPHTFYFTAPAGDSIWTPFSPGYDFNFNIQPRLQVANDLAILDILSPVDNDTIKYDNNDSLDMIARVINYGYANQSLFSVKMEVLSRFNQVVYSSSKLISLSAGDTADVTFDKFSKYNLGEFTARAQVDLNIDSVQDNNSKEVKFYLVKDHDVAVDIVYEPSQNDSFEIGKDGFWPAARIINYGIKDQINFPVKLELVNQDNQVVHSETQIKSLAAGLSEIITFDSVYLFGDGSFVLRVFTDLDIDSFRINDTTKVIIYAKKSHDVKILSIIRPVDESRFVLNSKFRPFINYRNEGLKDEDSTYFYTSIIDQNKNVLYTDTVLQSTSFFSTGQVLFKDFNCDSVGEYTYSIICFIKEDQVRLNDTMQSIFSVNTSNDLQIEEILSPSEVYEVEREAIYPEIIVRNNGLNVVQNAPIELSIANQLNTEHYLDTVYVSLKAFEADTFNFSKDLTFNELGDYFVSCSNVWSGEESPNELDSLSSTYITRYGKDLAVMLHNEPADNDSSEIFTRINPKLTVTNFGLDTLKNIAVIAQFYDNQQIAVYTDTMELDVLAPKRSNTFTSQKEWTALPGQYKFISSSRFKDDNDANDGLETGFVITKSVDIKLDSIEAPKAGERLRINRMYKPGLYLINDGLYDTDNIVVRAEIFVGANSIYAKSKIIELGHKQDTLLYFDSLLMHNGIANASAVFSVSKIGDVLASNDTLVSNFEFVDGSFTKNVVDAVSKVYPNPATNIVYVKSKRGIVGYKLYDFNGKSLKNELINNKLQVSIDFAQYNSGTYILVLEYQDFFETHTVLKAK